MTWTDYATWLGTGLSIVAMIVSIWQACRAKGSADQAKKMRDEISVRSAHNELSNLNGLLGSAIRSMDKYGPALQRMLVAAAHPTVMPLRFARSPVK